MYHITPYRGSSSGSSSGDSTSPASGALGLAGLGRRLPSWLGRRCCYRCCCRCMLYYKYCIMSYIYIYIHILIHTYDSTKSKLAYFFREYVFVPCDNFHREYHFPFEEMLDEFLSLQKVCQTT